MEVVKVTRLIATNNKEGRPTQIIERLGENSEFFFVSASYRRAMAQSIVNEAVTLTLCSGDCQMAVPARLELTPGQEENRKLLWGGTLKLQDQDRIRIRLEQPGVVLSELVLSVA